MSPAAGFVSCQLPTARGFRDVEPASMGAEQRLGLAAHAADGRSWTGRLMLLLKGLGAFGGSRRGHLTLAVDRASWNDPRDAAAAGIEAPRA